MGRTMMNLIIVVLLLLQHFLFSGALSSAGHATRAAACARSTSTTTNTAHPIAAHAQPRQPIDEIISLSIANAAKKPGSESYRRSWNRWSKCAISNIQNHLSSTLPTQPDQTATDELGFQLGMAADLGEMPSFADGGARAGYALRYFCRVVLLADIMFASATGVVVGHVGTCQDESEDYFGSSIRNLLCNQSSSPPSSSYSSTVPSVCRVGSLGGGPGFDFVAAVLLSTHSALERKARHHVDVLDDEYRHMDREELMDRVGPAVKRLRPEEATTVQATVYEYETGWSDVTSYMEEATRHVLGGEHSLDFASCDITRSLLSHPSNSACLEQANSTDMWICSYCVAENAVRLRNTDFVFFAELFQEAREGALFIFTETTHRLWPEIIDVATTGACRRVWLSGTRRSRPR